MKIFIQTIDIVVICAMIFFILQVVVAAVNIVEYDDNVKRHYLRYVEGKCFDESEAIRVIKSRLVYIFVISLWLWLV